MPDAQNKKIAKTTAKPFYRRKVFWLLALVLFVAGGGFSASKILKYRNDKAIVAERTRFEQADKDIQKIAADIIAATGQPYKIEQDKYCSRPNVKFTDAPLSCSVRRDFYYLDIDNVEATNMFKFANSVLSESITLKGISSSSGLVNPQFNPIAPPNDQKIFTDLNDEKANMDCKATYTYYSSLNPPSSNNIAIGSKFVLHLGLSCSDYARSEYYSLRK